MRSAPFQPVTAIYIRGLATTYLAEATIRGHFGIHHPRGTVESLTLTHIGSGCAIAKELPDIAVAAELADWLESLNVSWDFAEMDTIQHWPKKMRSAIAARVAASSLPTPKPRGD